MTKLTWYKIGFYVAVILDLMLAWQLYRIKYADESAAEYGNRGYALTNYILGIQRLPDVTVIDRNGGEYRLPQLAGEDQPAVFVFFTPGDCPVCFEEKSLWQEIPDRSGVAVYGVASNPDADEFWRWVDQTGINIPVYLDTTFAALDSMDFRVRPLKVVVDGYGVAVWADPVRKTPPARQAFWGELRTVLTQIQ